MQISKGLCLIAVVLALPPLCELVVADEDRPAKERIFHILEEINRVLSEVAECRSSAICNANKNLFASSFRTG